MNKVLDVHAAELITAAVEVKTLTIRGKQVTLAVFRQLEEKPLLLDDGSLAGIPWGRVNYHPDRCADDAAHMHVVWQEGSELRRARVATSPWFDTFWQAGDLNDFVSVGYGLQKLGYLKGDKFWAGLITECVKRHRGSAYVSTPVFTFKEYPDVRIGAALDIPLDGHLLPDLPGLARYERAGKHLALMLEANPEDSLPVQRARQDCLSEIEAAHEAALTVHNYVYHHGRPSLDEARAELLVEVAEENSRRERIRAATAMLADLSQLFIAV